MARQHWGLMETLMASPKGPFLGFLAVVAVLMVGAAALLQARTLALVFVELALLAAAGLGAASQAASRNRSQREIDELKRAIRVLQDRLRGQSIVPPDEKQALAMLRQRQPWSWLLFVLLFALTVAAIWLLPAATGWRWLYANKNHLAIQVGAQILAFFGLLNIPMRRLWVSWLVTMGATAAGGLMLQMIDWLRH